MGSISFINRGGSGGGQKASANIFAQTSEPATKEGVWIKANKSFNKILIKQDTVGAATATTYTPTNPFSDAFNRPRLISDNNLVFYANGNSTKTTKLCIFNIDTKEIKDVNINITGLATPMLIADGVLYLLDLWGVKKAYKYNISTGDTEEITTSGTKPTTNYYTCFSTYVGNKIYLFTPASSAGYIFDITTGAFSALPAAPFTYKNSDSYNFCCSNGVDKIYISSSDNKIYTFDINKQQFELFLALDDLVTNGTIPSYPSDFNITFYKGSLYSYISYKKESEQATKYGILQINTTNKNSKLLIADIETVVGNLTGGGVIAPISATANGIISLDYKSALLIDIPDATFEANSFLIKVGKTYQTELLAKPSNIDGRVTTGIDDAWLTKEDGTLDDTLPTYYGTGTEWVKFKN